MHTRYEAVDLILPPNSLGVQRTAAIGLEDKGKRIERKRNGGMRDFYPCRFHQLRVKSHLFSGVVKRVHKAGGGKGKQQSAFLQHDAQSTQRDCSVSGDEQRAGVQSVFGVHRTCTVRFQVLIVVLLKTMVLQEVIPCPLVNCYRSLKDHAFIFRGQSKKLQRFSVF
jgi:hypothetical protein